MSYIVSARKYRPKKFEEVIGQEHITTTLKNALLNDKLAHAFLFCGPRGVGKTTCARLLAKVINMPDPKKAIADGSYAETNIDISLNIIELDAASNNSVEHIRTLIEQVRFQPQHGKFKVFIIDEVHMLSQAAFNAFLKTLEEPPPYAIFILATTEKHKILPTILSRCQLYDFRRIKVPAIIQQLESIAKEEDILVEHDALFVIAEKADGAMRDALSMFDRIASASKNKITYQAVVENLSILDFDYYFKAVNFLLTEDGPAMLLLFEEVMSNGFEGDTFIIGLAKHLRNLLYCKQEPTLRLLQVSDSLKKRYSDQSIAISYSTILTMLSLANDCDVNFPKAKDKRLHIEISLLKMCYANRKQEKAEGQIESLDQKKTSNRSTKPVSTISTSTEESIHKDSKSHINEEFKPSAAVASKVEIDDKNTKKFSTSPKKEKGSVEGVKTELLDTPSLTSLEELISEAEIEISVTNKVKKELVLEEAINIWTAYRKKNVSPTTSSILEYSILEVDKEQLKVYVPTNIAKEEIQQETELYSELREHFNQNDLIIEIKVARERFPESENRTQKRLFTIKEKYDHLINKNPLLENLIKELGLKLDQD